MEEVTIGITELYVLAKIVSNTGNSNIDSIYKMESLINKFKVERENSKILS